MIDFPSTLPAPLREGYSFSHGVTIVRSDSGLGRESQRMGFISLPSILSISFIFKSSSDAEIFENWYRNDISDGSDWFNLPLLTTIGYISIKCRFTKIYSGPELIGLDNWKITAEIELWEKPLVENSWTMFPEMIAYQTIIDFAINQEWPS